MSKRSLLTAFTAAFLSLSSPFFFDNFHAKAEGFGIMENSARGMSLAGGLVARGGDPSVLSYNPAAMTHLDGTRMQGNLAVTQMYWGVDLPDGSNTHSSHQTWPIPSLFFTHQLNDKIWLGYGQFTRFGLGAKYPNNWAGGLNIQAVQLVTQSINPNIAYKINDIFSVALGAELIYGDMQMRKNLAVNPMLQAVGANDVNIDGHGFGFGGNLALHARFNDQWSAGITYRAPMSLKVRGKSRYDGQPGSNPYLVGAVTKTYGPEYGEAVRRLQNSNLRGTLHLPDSFAFGISYSPTANLSFEAGATYTVWSRFSDFNMYMKEPVNAWNTSDRHWRNSWAFNISTEYKPVDWMALRLGFMLDRSPMNIGNADYMVPSNSRSYYTTGVGFFYGNWTIDLAYMYIHNHMLSFTESASGKTLGVKAGGTTHPHAHNFGIGIGYKF